VDRKEEKCKGVWVPLYGIASQAAEERLARFLELPHGGVFEGVGCEGETAAAEDLHHEEGKDDLHILGKRMGGKFEVIGPDSRHVGGDEGRLGGGGFTWEGAGRLELFLVRGGGKIIFGGGEEGEFGGHRLLALKT